MTYNSTHLSYKKSTLYFSFPIVFFLTSHKNHPNMKSYHKSEDLSLYLKIDKEFRGIIRGFAYDESEGCILSGELVLVIYRRSKIRSLETSFEGQVCVGFKTTNSVGVPTTNGTETRTICRRSITHFNEDTVRRNRNSLIKSTMIEPGTYKFPFKFSISAALPHSFKGKYGTIQYDLGATATRTLFSNDIHIVHPIMLRRCLMNDLDPVAAPSQQVTGSMHPELVAYSATAPAMVYCEGGLLTLGLNVRLKNPAKYSVSMVTCGLQERVFYRTTGRRSLTNQPMHYNECTFPLGCSTFFPSKHAEYNPFQLHDYNAIFRLYPRVQPDNKSSLIVVQHSLLITMCIDNNDIMAAKKRKGSGDSVASNTSTKAGKSILSHLTLKQQDHNLSRSMPDIVLSSNHRNNTGNGHHRHGSLTPSLSRSPSPDELSLSSGSQEYISSTTSLGMAVEQLQSFQSNLVRVTSRKLTPQEEIEACTTSNATVTENSASNSSTAAAPAPPPQSRRERLYQQIGHSLAIHHHLNPLHFRRDSASDGMYECSLNVPIIVTSREEYREGQVPPLPDYQTAAQYPPSYLASIQTLPPVPVYPPVNEDNDMIRRNYGAVFN
jgi:hypothetical protein